MYIEKEEDVDIDTRGRYILKEEFEQALRELNDRKAAGTDKIPAEIVKIWTKTHKNPKFSTEIYEYNVIPTDFTNHLTKKRKLYCLFKL